MDDATLMLIELDDPSGLLVEPFCASHELYLAEFASRVHQLARPQDKVAQIHPNKWCVLLQGVRDPQQIQLAGAKLVRLFHKPVTVLNDAIDFRVHAAFVPPGVYASSPETRLKVAEAGVLHARRSDQPFVIRDEGANRAAEQHAHRVCEVETALERGEFHLYFQPKVHCGFRSVIGAEALMRWHSAVRGVVQPGEFLPFVERRSTLRDFTWFALKSAVGQCARWSGDVGVAVNVPAEMLNEPGLTDQISDSLAIFSLAPHRLTVEITEEAMIDDPQRALRTLGVLRELGVKISIDDFGTGYSSLAYFRDLPVDELKVDRSFVSNMLKSPKDHDIVKAIIGLAHNFSLNVVAEGVEDAATASALAELGCDVLQGFLFGKPQPPEAFVRHLMG